MASKKRKETVVRGTVAEIERATGEEVHRLVNRGLVSLDFDGYTKMTVRVMKYKVSITKKGRGVLGNIVKDFKDSSYN